MTTSFILTGIINLTLATFNVPPVMKLAALVVGTICIGIAVYRFIKNY